MDFLENTLLLKTLRNELENGLENEQWDRRKSIKGLTGLWIKANNSSEV